VRPHLRPPRASLCAFLVACLLAPAASGQTSQAGPPQVERDLSSIKIANFGRVNEHYYRGAQPDESGYADLAAIGIKTLINLAGDDAKADEQHLVERAGMRYVQIPMTTHENPTPENVTEFLRIVNDPASQPVYVHCVGGRHRTGVMSAVYRMTTDGWTADQAFTEMKQYKFGADFLHREFKAFVYGYRSDAGRASAAPATLAQATKPQSKAESR
jgi:tyrosine-protein phosphatase SIW14